MRRIDRSGFLGGSMAFDVKAPVALSGVPETMLWTLYHRALEARRADPVLTDPMAVDLVESIDYPFEQRFGAHAGVAQGQALRARRFDNEVRRFLAAHPDGTVVALGEGLETQFWRVDNGRVQWLSVDLPESVELRSRLLPSSPRLRTIAGSVLDKAWLDEVDPTRGVLLTAQGLLMYLRPGEVRRLIAGSAQRFPGGALLFDAVPRWFSARTMSGQLMRGQTYQPPPMPWGLDPDQQQQIRTVHPNVAEVRDLRLPPGRGVFYGVLVPRLHLIPVIRARRPSIVLLRFGLPE
jgi:O-methyltransferase involved in polyketide biosynthesis